MSTTRPPPEPAWSARTATSAISSPARLDFWSVSNPARPARRGRGPQRPILDVAGHGSLYEAVLSPSNRRVAFTLARPDGTAALLLADASRPSSADTSIRLADDRNYLGALSWSRDDRMLYFASASDGFICIWAQRFAADGAPEGEPVAAFHNHAPPNMQSSASLG